MAARAAHRVEVALVELLQGALQLAALRLPLLEVPHGLQGRPLPCGGPGVVVHVVDPAPVVHSSLPATARTAIKTDRAPQQKALGSSHFTSSK